jgi:hypothetical protein
LLEFETIFDFRSLSAGRRLLLGALASVGGAAAKDHYASAVEAGPKVDVVHLFVAETAFTVR